MSFEVILPFLRPIAHLIQDPDVSEIMVNGSRWIFVECQGLIREVSDIRLDERNLRVAVKNIARLRHRVTAHPSARAAPPLPFETVRHRRSHPSLLAPTRRSTMCSHR